MVCSQCCICCPLQSIPPERSLQDGMARTGSMHLLTEDTWTTFLFSHIRACIMHEPQDVVLASLAQAECLHLRGPVLKGM